MALNFRATLDSHAIYTLNTHTHSHSYTLELYSVYLYWCTWFWISRQRANTEEDNHIAQWLLTCERHRRDGNGKRETHCELTHTHTHTHQQNVAQDTNKNRVSVSPVRDARQLGRKQRHGFAVSTWIWCARARVYASVYVYASDMCVCVCLVLYTIYIVGAQSAKLRWADRVADRRNLTVTKRASGKCPPCICLCMLEYVPYAAHTQL